MFTGIPSKSCFEIVCRLCGEQCSELIKLHLRKNRQRNLKESIRKYIGIKITPGDRLPDQVCGPCIAKLDETADFINKCREMQKKLQNASEEDIVEYSPLSQSPDLTIKQEPFEESSILVVNAPNTTVEEDKKSTSNRRYEFRTISEVPPVYNYSDDATEFVDVSFIEEETRRIEKDNESTTTIKIPKKRGRKPKEPDPLKRKRIALTDANLPSDKNPKATAIESRKDDEKRVISLKCSQCDRKFGTRRNLKVHIKRVHLEKMEKCPKCDKVLRSKYLWKRHMIIHSGEKKFRCEKCDKSYLSASMLRIHQNTHLPMEERYKYDCDVCGKKFTSKNIIQAHMRLHTGVTPFVCDQCGKKYLTKGNLQSHYRVHTGEKPYECDVCGKKYMNANPFKVHKRTHTGAKPFVCSHCSKTFNSPSVLKRHVLIHTGARPCPCRYCDKRFIDHGKRKVHERIHTGERPYKCLLCTSAFHESGNLRKHCKNVHNQDFNATPLEQEAPVNQNDENLSSQDEQQQLLDVINHLKIPSQSQEVPGIPQHNPEPMGDFVVEPNHSQMNHSIFSSSDLYLNTDELPL